MDMDVYKVNEIIKNNPRFISPFAEPYGYYIVEDGRVITEQAIQFYWEALHDIEKNTDRRIQQGFQHSFYNFYGVNKKIAASPADMCQRLIIESFTLLLRENANTIGCCLSNPEFMFGHYIAYDWDFHWNFLGSYIC